MTQATVVAVLLLALMVPGVACAAGCGSDDTVQLEWPASSYDRILAAYVASSLLPVPSCAARPTLAERLASPPFITGEGRVALDLASLDPDSAAAFLKASEVTGAGHVLAWEAFLPVAEARYLKMRYFSANLPALHQYLALLTDPAWVAVKVRSLISGGERRVWFHVKHVLEGTLDALESGKPLLFPRGAWFVAEHLDAQGNVVETHATGKRPDWEWDYGLYDKHGVGQVESSGRYALHSETRAPSSCYSCHEISARVSPFAEFPDPAEPVGGLQPEVLLALSPADAAIVRKLSLPKGGDQVMGQYGGLAALCVRTWRQAGTAPAWSEPLWQRLLSFVPELAR